MEDNIKMDPKGIHGKDGKCVAVKWHRSKIYVQVGLGTSSVTCRMAHRRCSVFESLLQDTNPLIYAKFITVVWIGHQMLWLSITRKLEAAVCGWVHTNAICCGEISAVFGPNAHFRGKWRVFFIFLQRNKLYRITSRYCDWANDRKVWLSSLGKSRNFLFSKMSRLAFQTASYSVGNVVR